ncbi:MAG: cbb3-type cytochrome oxidase assembly protein CcoS [Gammaproteobacteria bacterium]|nr:MAG: cbb3-type cytochrome oxidase assembly protein CcoS [Gammaproteobacteria bacterium]RLA52720.1 MAG: cbb3-type cytochrome oxidase assembly protein CcoS [Gammaproteobacteria bacterium]
MESLYLLIPLSIAVLGVGVVIFFWAVNSGQYDDLDGEAERILFDDVEADALPLNDGHTRTDDHSEPGQPGEEEVRGGDD